jgi:hypothetical protein
MSKGVKIYNEPNYYISFNNKNNTNVKITELNKEDESEEESQEEYIKNYKDEINNFDENSLLYYIFLHIDREDIIYFYSWVMLFIIIYLL